VVRVFWEAEGGIRYAWGTGVQMCGPGLVGRTRLSWEDQGIKGYHNVFRSSIVLIGRTRLLTGGTRLSWGNQV